MQQKPNKNINNTKPAGPCLCGSNSWWYRPPGRWGTGGWLCTRCHPEPKGLEGAGGEPQDGVLQTPDKQKGVSKLPDVENLGVNDAQEQNGGSFETKIGSGGCLKCSGFTVLERDEYYRQMLEVNCINCGYRKAYRIADKTMIKLGFTMAPVGEPA